MANKPRSFNHNKTKDISAADTSATLQTWKYGCNDDIITSYDFFWFNSGSLQGSQ